MNFLILSVIVLSVSSRNIFRKIYSDKRGKENIYIFNMVAAITSIIFFLLWSRGNLKFDLTTTLYAVGFGICFLTCMTGMGFAIKYGSLSLTSLVLSYSLIIPTLHGIIFLKEAVKPALIIGLLLLLASLYLINKSDEKSKITLKWGVFALLAFLGNGGCSTVQKMQQVACGGNYKNEFMIFAMLVVAVVMAVKGLLIDRDFEQLSFKNGGICAPAYGCANALANLLVMVLSGLMSSSLMFPTISGGGIIVTWIVSKFFFKEKLTTMQNAGVILGIAAVVILSI